MKFLTRDKKIMKIIKFNSGINKKFEEPRIPNENHENIENLIIPNRITKILKILDFHMRILKIFKKM